VRTWLRKVLGRPPVGSHDDAVAAHARITSASRRAFSRNLALVAAGFATIRLGLTRLSFGRRMLLAAEPPSTEPLKPNARWGMTIDLDRCTGCGACVVACRTENNVPYFGPAEEARGTEIYWMDLLTVDPGAAEGRGHADMLPLPCMHCDDPPCVKVCPTNATYRTEDGLVAQIYDRCIGCRYCQVACPYGRRYFNWTSPEWPDSYRSFLNPDVATRPSGIVEKCTFCSHRLQRVHEQARLEERTPRDDELRRLPACSQACPADAIAFGDLADPSTEVSQLAGSPRAFRLLEHLGTKPKVVYLSKDKRTA
jgi:molybdopterin-containing oxidoreductase family iron-sulfur binding subunit